MTKATVGNAPAKEELMKESFTEVLLGHSNSSEFPLYAIFCHNCGFVNYSCSLSGDGVAFCDGPNNNDDCRTHVLEPFDGGEITIFNFDIVELTGRDEDWTEWKQAQIVYHFPKDMV